MKNTVATYDRLAVGDRIRQKRVTLGLTQDELSEMIGRVPKYCADIERGNCGMSIETMLSFSKVLHLPLDYMIYGEASTDYLSHITDETTAILEQLDSCDKRQRKYALRLLQLFIAANLLNCSDRPNLD